MPSSCMCMSVKHISYMKIVFLHICDMYMLCIYGICVYMLYIFLYKDVLHPKPLVLVFKSIYITIVNMYFEYDLFKA